MTVYLLWIDISKRRILTTLGMDRWDSSLSISSLHAGYEAGITPTTVIHAVYERIEAYKDVQSSVWIYVQPLDITIQAAIALESRWPDPNFRPPLWGVPFSVKDNIDIAGIATTCGLPAFAYTPEASAPVYQKCIDAGALFIGKTNMEQLATGMTGCRSPYGTLHSTWSKDHIVGGSSSGSAVSVSAGLVSFSLGSDTAGSIRVPALFNGLVGFKPTKGTVSARGVVPACRHQDTVGFLALIVEDAEVVWRVCKGFDKNDPFAKRDFIVRPSDGKQLHVRFGTPSHAALGACSPTYGSEFAHVVHMMRSLMSDLVDLDWEPFAAANELLYNGSFVLERLTILPKGWFEIHKQELHPVTRQVFEGALAKEGTAVDVFEDLHKQAECKRKVEEILTFVEGQEENVLTVMVVPTAPSHPTIEEVGGDPIGCNAKLGIFAHFANVLDLVGISLPAGSYSVPGEEGRELRLPFGVTILTGAGFEEELITLAQHLEGLFTGLVDQKSTHLSGHFLCRDCPVLGSAKNEELTLEVLDFHNASKMGKFLAN
jgi:allophanate hydrolase